MNKQFIFISIALTAAVSAVFLCISVFGENQAMIVIDDVAAYYYIRKSYVWMAACFFCLSMIIVRRFHALYINKRRDAERFMLKAEEILRLLVNDTPDLIFFKDAEGRYLEINDSSLELFGFDRESSKGMKKNQLDELSPLYRQISGNCSTMDMKAWEQGSIIRSTEIITMPDGETRSYDIIKSPVFYKNGKRKGIVTLARDISDYKKTEQKLERKEKILRATLNATDDGILVVDNNRQILDGNDMYFSMWKIPYDIYSLNNEAANIKFIMKQLVDPDNFEAWVNFTYEIPISEYYQAELLDGRVFDIYSAPLMDKGHMIGRVWSFRDITARVSAENELQRSEERYRTLVELSPDAIFVSTQEKIAFSNIAGIKLLGADSMEEIYQKSIHDFVHQDRRNLTGQSFSDIINGKVKKLVVDHEIVQLNGKSIEIEAVCSIVPYKGENAVMCVVRDISERRNNEDIKRRIDENLQLVNKTLEYDKIRTEYFANISHEIKTPLNVIIGTLQLFELIINDQHENEGFDRLAKYNSIMKHNCFRLLRMFNNLIYITEVDSGFIDMNYQNHDLVQILKNLMSVSGRFVERKGAHLETSMNPLSLRIACDAEKIKRVLLNLLSNAVKFTEKGDEIRVSLYNDEDYAYISVKDTGIGIEENMKGAIFERFRQVDKSFTRKCEGSGIGLYLAKSLVEMHGGSIEVISEYGKGSEFIMKLPIWFIGNEEIAAAGTLSTNIDMVSIEFSDIY